MIDDTVGEARMAFKRSDDFREMERAKELADRFRKFKLGWSWGTWRIHPTLRVEDRDLIVKALEQFNAP
jgi:hypothetical protein